MASVIWTSAPSSRRDIWNQNSPAIDSHEQLASYVAERFGANAAAVFAVPARQSDGSVSWTDRLGTAQSRPLSELTGDEKARASASLRQSLHTIETGCDGSPRGQLLLAALTVESADAIRIADGRPVIAGWGAVPPHLTTPEQLAAHHAATLGPYLSRVEPPRFWVTSVANIPVLGRLYGSRGLLAAVVVAALVLLWLLLPGVLRSNYSTAPLTDFVDPNRSIERQIETVKRSLESNVCIATSVPRLEITPDAGTVPAGRVPDSTPVTQGRIVPSPGESPGPVTTQPGDTPAATPVPGTSPSPLASPSPGATEAPATPVPGATPGRTGEDVTTPRPEQVATPTQPIDPNTTQVSPQVNPGSSGAPALATLLKKSTVIIVTKTGTGSGFFVSRDQIMTNRHVTENSGNQFMVGNETIGKLVPADLVAASDVRPIGEPDFALLKLRSGSSESFLSFSDSLPFELENVIAIGYPGFMIKEDQSLQKMMQGQEMAHASLSSGSVTYIQNSSGPAPVILHYAQFSPGNSGGPLTDQCGRVVGINTFVRKNEEWNARVNYSLASRGAITFLKGLNVTPTVVPGHCTTTMAGTPGGSGTPGTPPAPTPAPETTPGQTPPAKSAPPAKSTPPAPKK